jgi:hypothetical protein
VQLAADMDTLDCSMRSICLVRSVLAWMVLGASLARSSSDGAVVLRSGGLG